MLCVTATVIPAQHRWSGPFLLPSLIALAILSGSGSRIQAQPVVQPGNGDPEPSEATQPQADASEQISDEEGTIRQWIADLDASSFDRRRRATMRLITRGDAAVVREVTKLVVGAPSVEAQIRGLVVLERIATAPETIGGSAADAALLALEELAADPQSLVAGRAGQHLEAVRGHYEMLAVGELKRKGAQFGRARSRVNLPLGEMTLVLNDAWEGTVSDLDAVRHLYSIRELRVEGDRFDDSCGAPLSRFPELRRMILKDTRIGDKGMASLAQAKALEALTVWYCPISNQSVKTWESMQHLRYVELLGSAVTPSAMESFRRRSPTMVVIYRRGGFLGVAPIAPTGPCIIANPTAGGAAERAGLRSQDTIVKYRGEPVADFEALRKLIENDPPELEVEVEIIRNGETLIKKVKLDRWEQTPAS